MRLLAAITVGVALASCGSSASAQRTFTERDVIRALHLRVHRYVYVDPRGCEVNQILNTPEEVDLYRSAGDTVISDRSNTVGVKAVGASRTCRTRFRRELNRLVG